MAIKGFGYTKTTWAFQERPVASSKLNTWDDRIEAALELVHFLLSLAWGGGDGVVRGATANDLKVTALAVPKMSVQVAPGYAFISKAPYRLMETTQTVDVVAPASQPRIDLVQARLSGWDVTVKQGVEAANPTAPHADADCLALATLYLRPGMACINNANDNANGYIVDARPFL
jgi:hypothetical protein